MEQGVPGSQSEDFFELLHPNSARDRLPPAASSSSSISLVNSVEDGSPPQDPSHPNTARDPPPPSPPALPPAASSSSSTSSVNSVEDGSPPQDPSSLHTITPSYDFQLTHTVTESYAKLEDAPPPTLHGASSVVSSEGSSIDTSRGLVYGRPLGATNAGDRVTMDAIDRAMRHHTGNLLEVLECVNGRLSQLEHTVQGLERTVSVLRIAEEEKQDRSDGRLSKLELLIEEVHRGVQLLHERQRVEEGKSHLNNQHCDDQKFAERGLSQAPGEGWQQPKTAEEDFPHATYSESPPQLPPHVPSQYPPPAQSHYPPASPPTHMQAYATSQGMLPLPSTTNGPPSNQQPFPPTGQHLPPQQQATHVPQPPLQHSPQIPAFHSQPAPQSPPPSSYGLPIETTVYSHMHPPHHRPPPPSSSYLSSEPSQYEGGMHGGLGQPPVLQGPHHPSQQHSPIDSQYTYDSISGRMGPVGSGLPQSYSQPPPLPKLGPPVPSKYETASGGGYGAPPYRSAQPAPTAPSGGGPGYPRLPTAQPIQSSLPSASPILSGTPTRSPTDDVIEKVASMGFHREQVRGVVRHLTENGQSVDLNVVLDKLMNGGDSSQPARGWFNRG